jgi:hypothetical protein
MQKRLLGVVVGVKTQFGTSRNRIAFIERSIFGGPLKKIRIKCCGTRYQILDIVRGCYKAGKCSRVDLTPALRSSYLVDRPPLPEDNLFTPHLPVRFENG